MTWQQRGTRAARRGVALLAQGWRLWLGMALLGALLGTGLSLRTPPRWVSEGALHLRPRFMLEGYLLATQELTRHYAARLQDTKRLARVLAPSPPPAVPTIEAWGAPGATVRLRVIAPDPARAEATARALLVELRAEIERENQARMEADRLEVTLSPTSFARPLDPPWWQAAGRAGLLGLAAGLSLVLLRGWHRRGRVRAAPEAEALTNVPTLAIIPRR